MIRLVPAHHLVARNTIGDRVHDRPLGRRDVPAALGLLPRQFDNAGSSHVRVQLVVLDENAAPDDLTRLADALNGTAAGGEVHRRLALAGRAGVLADEVLW